MRVSRLSFAALFAASVLSPRLLSADVISGSVSCSSPSGDYYNLTSVSQTSSRSCGVQTTITNVPAMTILWSGVEAAQASVSGNYLLSSNGISGELDGSVSAYPHSMASAQITFSDTFTTDGPERTGLVIGYFQPGTFHYGGSVSAAIVSPTFPYATFTEAAPNMPFDLGQPFTLTIVAQANALSDDGTLSDAQFQVPFTLSFFEADGVTPVALTEVSEVAQAPEPASVALSLIGVVGVIALRGRRAAR